MRQIMVMEVVHGVREPPEDITDEERALVREWSKPGRENGDNDEH